MIKGRSKKGFEDDAVVIPEFEEDFIAARKKCVAVSLLRATAPRRLLIHAITCVYRSARASLHPQACLSRSAASVQPSSVVHAPGPHGRQDLCTSTSSGEAAPVSNTLRTISEYLLEILQPLTGRPLGAQLA